MGDNRNNSQDSRHSSIGLVEKREILGRVIFLLIPGTDEGNLPADYSRIGGLN
jgi:signal peptidase I